MEEEELDPLASYDESYDPITGTSGSTPQINLDQPIAPIANPATLDEVEASSEPVVTHEDTEVAEETPLESPETPVNAPESDVSPEEDTFLKDILMSPLRGTEQAVRDTWNFLDWATFDVLPDAPGENKIFGHANSAVGGFLTEAINLMWGFMPLAGGIGKLGKLGAVNLTKSAEIAAKEAGKNLNAFGIRVGRETLAGAGADFMFYQEGEERLSNMLEQMPELSNPISEYLAWEEGEEQGEGRLKAALEGSVIGVGMEVVFQGLKSLKHVRRIFSAGGGPKDAEEFLQTRAEDHKNAILDPSGKKGLDPAFDPAENARRYEEAQAEYDAMPDVTPEVDALTYQACNHG